jgi:hypothetical protein
VAHNSILGSTYDEMPPLDGHKWVKPRREIVTRATEAVSAVGTLALLVILAAEEPMTHTRADVDIEQLCEYRDWVG